MSSLTRRFCWLPLGLYSLGVAVVVGLPGDQCPSFRGSGVESAESRVGALEEATPDSGPNPPYPFPKERREDHLAALGVPAWHAAGYRGQGIKIAVLDSGFRGYRAHLGAALPRTVACKSFRRDADLEAKNSQHGILCAEVLHALAPEAQLLLANWDPDRPDEFLEAVRWSKNQGARIISCSVIMPSWSDGDGRGAFEADLSRLLASGNASGGLLCCASAGNTAQRHWTGSYRPGTTGYHEWTAGTCWNAVRPWGTEQVSVELYGHGNASYSVEVEDVTTGRMIGTLDSGHSSERIWSTRRFVPAAGHSYRTRVRLLSGTPGSFHMVVLGGGLGVAVREGSVCCPADDPAVVAVGAVDFEGKRLPYSSCGPNSGTVKPDLVAPVPFPSLWRSRPFSGTSAAAPQVAGLASLIWCRCPSWTADQIREALYGCAKRADSSGSEWETGYGFVQLSSRSFFPTLRNVPGGRHSELTYSTVLP